MIKSLLVERMIQRMSHLPPKDVEHGVNGIIDVMIDALSHGRRIEIRGFGSFCLHHRAPRLAHNPKTGEKLITHSKYTPYFKAGKEMRERVNEDQKSAE